MPEVPAGTGDGAAPRSPGRGPAESGPERETRPPGWRQVLLVAALVLGAVFAVEVLSSLLPPVREAFRALPITIVALVAGTVGLLLLIAIRRPRH